MTTPVRATLVHAGMPDAMASRWAPRIEAAIARDGDSEFAPSPALTSTDQLEAEQRGLPIPYPSPALTREALARILGDGDPDWRGYLKEADRVLAGIVALGTPPPAGPNPTVTHQLARFHSEAPLKWWCVPAYPDYTEAVQAALSKTPPPSSTREETP